MLTGPRGKKGKSIQSRLILLLLFILIPVLAIQLTSIMTVIRLDGCRSFRQTWKLPAPSQRRSSPSCRMFSIRNLQSVLPSPPHIHDIRGCLSTPFDQP